MQHTVATWIFILSAILPASVLCASGGGSVDSSPQVAGTVHGLNQRPLQRIRVDLLDGSDCTFLTGPGSSAYTDAEGRFAIPVPTNESLTLLIDGTVHLPMYERRIVRLGDTSGTHQGLLVELRPAEILRGSIDKYVEPVGGGQLRVGNLDSECRIATLRTPIRANGSFVLLGVPAGTYEAYLEWIDSGTLQFRSKPLGEVRVDASRNPVVLQQTGSSKEARGE